MLSGVAKHWTIKITIYIRVVFILCGFTWTNIDVRITFRNVSNNMIYRIFVIAQIAIPPFPYLFLFHSFFRLAHTHTTHATHTHTQARMRTTL